MDDDGPRRRAMTVADDAREVSAVSEAVGDGKHSGPADAQVARRLRPLRRRPARIARPARVRMRRRKPCVLLRLRLFGWNVRLLTRTVSEDRHWLGHSAPQLMQLANSRR